MIKQNISTGQQQFIKNSIRMNLRIDGRQNLDFRETWLQLNTLQQANGSCSLQTFGSDVKIYTGIKAQVGDVNKIYPNEGIINISISSNQSSDQKSNKQMSDDICEMKSILEKFILSNIDKQQLLIVKYKKCWEIFVDVYIVGQIELAYLDNICVSVKKILTSKVKGAFQDLKLPKLVVNHNLINDEDEIDLFDENITTFIEFNMNNFPMLCTIGEVDNQFIVDLTLEEFYSVDSLYIIAYNGNKQILGIHKLGDGLLKPESIFKLTNIAHQSIQFQSKSFSTLISAQ